MSQLNYDAQQVRHIVNQDIPLPLSPAALTDNVIPFLLRGVATGGGGTSGGGSTVTPPSVLDSVSYITFTSSEWLQSGTNWTLTFPLSSELQYQATVEELDGTGYKETVVDKTTTANALKLTCLAPFNGRVVLNAG
jgi:hypothetical protein